MTPPIDRAMNMSACAIDDDSRPAARPRATRNKETIHKVYSCVRATENHADTVEGRPNFKYSVGTTTMFSSVELRSPDRITIAMGV